MDAGELHQVSGSMSGALRFRQRVGIGVWLPLLLVALLLLVGCNRGSELSSFEREALALDKRLICPVCPGETLDQSRAELAKQMRLVVREKLTAGEPREQILRFFVDRYGPGVLAQPPKGGFNLLAWLVPPLVVLGGVATLWVVLRRMGRRSRDSGLLDPADTDQLLQNPELEPYLAQVDQEFEDWVRSPRKGEAPSRPSGKGG